jgi:hypothetical protein
MAEATFACPKCRTPLAVPEGANPFEVACPGCSSEMEAFFFTAFFRPRTAGAAATTLVDHSEASCFYHPQKQAVQVCDGCGRFICALCSIEMDHEHLCPSCLSAGKRKGKITSLENTRTCYDRIALSVACLGIIIWPVSFILASAAIYLSIRHWNSPGSLLGVSRNRFIIAIVIASLELIGWIIVGLVFFFSHAKPSP